MLKSKKFVIIALLSVVILGASLGGIAVAQADDETTPPQNTKINLLDKVAEIYEKNTGVAMDSAELQKAFTEAGQALRDESFDARLQELVEAGKITQEQADNYMAWLEAKPDDISLGPMGRSDMPRVFDRFGGMFKGGFRGHCTPDNANQ